MERVNGQFILFERVKVLRRGHARFEQGLALGRGLGFGGDLSGGGRRGLGQRGWGVAEKHGAADVWVDGGSGLPSPACAKAREGRPALPSTGGEGEATRANGRDLGQRGWRFAEEHGLRGYWW